MNSKINNFYNKIKTKYNIDLTKTDDVLKLQYDERDNANTIVTKIQRILTISSDIRKLAKNIKTMLRQNKLSRSSKNNLSRDINKLNNITNTLNDYHKSLIDNRLIVLSRDKAFQETQTLNDNTEVSVD